MIATTKSGFTPAPAGTHKAVLVDVTPLKLIDGQYGPRELFSLVFELEEAMEDGTRYTVRSRLFSPSTHEKSAFRPFLERLLGRKLSPGEVSGFECDTLIGTVVEMEIEHEETEKGTFARIAYVKRITDPLEPSGDYIRIQDRPEEKQNEFRRTSGAGKDKPKATQSPDDVTHPGKIKVHVGKFSGHPLEDIAEADITSLIDHWLKKDFKKIEKPSADDRRLAGALTQYEQRFNSQKKSTEPEDDVPY